MSLARKHREKILASLSAAVAPALAGGLAPASNPGPAAAMAGQVALRLMHDQRRLKQIQSIEAKVAAKREMLPEYGVWISGLLEAGEVQGLGSAEPVLPTIMVWKIDTGDYAGALILADYVLRFGVPLPAQYQRQPATLIVEEIAEAAIKAQLAGLPFDLDILEQVEALSADRDMPDEVRAKLFKAIGFELHERSGTGDEHRAQLERALAALKRAQQLHDRVGAKDRIKRIEKALKAAGPATGNASPAAG
ncbi:MAG: terminase [Sphingomonas bacterium]|nr:terminase [Sphingomonas bacterium]